MATSSRTLRSTLIALIALAALGLALTTLHAEDAAKAPRLVIKKALYGDLPDGTKIDVTKKVAEMVKDDTLSVAATNENFTDPVEGTVKKLQVDYTFDGKDKSKTVNEGETLTISNTGE